MRFISGLVANFYYLMLVMNGIKPKDYDLTNIYFIKYHWYELFDTTYLKCSNNFAADCITVKTKQVVGGKRPEQQVYCFPLNFLQKAE